MKTDILDFLNKKTTESYTGDQDSEEESDNEDDSEDDDDEDDESYTNPDEMPNDEPFRISNGIKVPGMAKGQESSKVFEKDMK